MTVLAKRVILPKELSDASDFQNTAEFKKFMEQNKEEGVEESQFYIEGYVNELKKEKEAKKLKADGNEVYLITGGLIDALALGEPICINGIWIAISEKSEMKLIEGLEQRWADEWGLNAETEEK